MALTPQTLDGTLWIAEPTRLRMLALRVLGYPTCPTARELVKERRRRLEKARAPAVIYRADIATRMAGHLEELASGKMTVDEVRRAGGLPPLKGDTFHPDEQAQAKPLRTVKGGVGVVPVYGMIQQRLTPELLKAGGTSVEEIAASLDALTANKAVEAIVLDVDSPGGEVSGVPELADRLYAARGQKRLYASVNSLAASAGYWVASAAEQVMITPSGYAGSVGVYMLHQDASKALDTEGIKVSLVSAGKYKTETNPFEPLNADARAYLQSQVDATYGKFLKALSRNRDRPLDEVRSGFGQGRVMNAEQSVAAGLVDRQMSFDDLLGRLLGPASSGAGSKGGPSAEVLRARHEHEKRKAVAG